MRMLWALCAIVIAAGPALSQETEAPREYDPQELLGAKVKGPNYQVLAPVSSDGMYNLYRLETDYGALDVRSDTFLQIRLKELEATHKLEAVQATKLFRESVQNTLAAPFEFAVDAIKEPGETAKKTIGGIGRLIDRTASGIKNIGKTRGNQVSNLIGISRAKRHMAASLGVDPYSEYPPLAENLNRVARATALGGMTVKGAIALMPGGVAVAATAVSATSDVASLVRDKTVNELYDINHKLLIDAIGDETVVRLFLTNPNYTPGDQTFVAHALAELGPGNDMRLFLARAGTVATRDEAVLARESALLFSRYNKMVTPIARFASLGGHIVFADNDGRVIGLFPFDNLSWTPSVEEMISAISEGFGESDDVSLWITGTATDMAREKLTARGWKLVENASDRL